MPHPVLNVSVLEIQQEAASLVRDMEDALARHPRWECPMLSLAQEFQSLANAQPPDVTRIRDFTQRFREHIVSHRLKGFESTQLGSDLLHSTIIHRKAGVRENGTETIRPTDFDRECGIGSLHRRDSPGSTGHRRGRRWCGRL